MTLVWIDDMRDPTVDNWKSVFPIDNPDKVVWVKNYDEFVGWITENGLPDGIAFDHDLADKGKNLEEKTGMDCAKWLVDYCIDKGVKLPIFGSQSANPPGRQNILSLLNNFSKTQQ
jgi:hypothetical protein